MNEDHIVLDLFAGTGVGVACKRLGVTELGVEWMPEAIATRTANGMEIIYENVWDVHLFRMIWESWSEEQRENWTKWASPPCQTFSMAGNGAGRRALDDVLGIIARKQYLDIVELREQAALLGDERIGLVLTPLHYAIQFRPMFIALEQVPPVLPVWEAMAVELREAGYSVWTGYLHSEQYGVPQTRKRAYLMARRDGHDALPPVPTHSKYHNRDPEKLDAGVLKWVSMAEALGWGMNAAPYPTIASARASGGPDKEKVGGSGARKNIYDAKAEGRWVAEKHPQADGSVRLGLPEVSAIQSYPYPAAA